MCTADPPIMFSKVSLGLCVIAVQQVGQHPDQQSRKSAAINLPSHESSAPLPLIPGPGDLTHSSRASSGSMRSVKSSMISRVGTSWYCALYVRYSTTLPTIMPLSEGKWA